nr:hypothetical protein [Tanacetum cinerariifolium]
DCIPLSPTDSVNTVSAMASGSLDSPKTLFSGLPPSMSGISSSNMLSSSDSSINSGTHPRTSLALIQNDNEEDEDGDNEYEKDGFIVDDVEEEDDEADSDPEKQKKKKR